MQLNSDRNMSKIVQVHVKKINDENSIKWCFKTIIKNIYFVGKSIKYIPILSIVRM